MSTSPEWTHPILSDDELREFRDTLTVTPVDHDPDVAAAVLDWLRKDRRNGGAHLQGFQFAGPETFDWFARDRLLGQLPTILAHPTNREEHPPAFGSPTRSHTPPRDISADGA
jgi:hypothetical protein